MKNKKAAIGAAITWVVATIIILFLMIIFVYTSAALFGKGEYIQRFFAKGEQISSSADSEQMLLALLQKEIDGKSLSQIIVNEEELDKEEFHEIFDNLPTCLNQKQNKKDSWVLNYKNIGGSNFNSKGVGKPRGADLLRQTDEAFSIVYLGEKEIKLFEHCEVS